MEKTRSLWQLAAVTAILLLGLALRLAPWGDNRFLEDEALYATWGLQIATGADPLLDAEPVDKPPLHPYALALSFRLGSMPGPAGVGAGQETAARLPSLLASLASLVFVCALGRALWANTAIGLLAALLLALSPFDILFASTAFTDPLMTAWVLGALLAAAKGRPGAAGLLAGLAAATKQQGLLFLPLVVAVGALASARATTVPPPAAIGPVLGEQDRRSKRAYAWLAQAWQQPWVRAGLGFALVAGGVLWWDTARVQRPGFLEQSLISYGGLGLADVGTLGERAAEWLQLVATFWASPAYNAVMGAAIVLWLAGGFAGWWAGGTRIDWALVLFVFGYLLLHWLINFQVWDRYLLSLVPLVSLLAARAFVGLGTAIRARPWRRVYTVGLGLALAASLSTPLVQATRSELPVGGDHGAYDGIDHLAAYLRTHAPPGAVLYHHWLGYHYRYYLYGAPLRLHWYPDPADLAHDATVYRHEPRYIAFPSWQASTPAETTLAAAGIRLVPISETTRRDSSVSFRLYRLEGP